MGQPSVSSFLGDEGIAVRAGDAVLIPPGTAHKLVNESDARLVLRCACSPPYRDDDTELLE
jgi:mannose-6-phosphate isomerase-like protein (cupin superfamily)